VAAHGTHDPAPSFTKSVGATSASTIVAVPSTAPRQALTHRFVRVHVEQAIPAAENRL
jgi:hypothetical protein